MSFCNGIAAMWIRARIGANRNNLLILSTNSAELIDSFTTSSDAQVEVMAV